MSIFYISSWLKKILLQNYKNYIACLETLGQAINRPHYFWKNLYAQVIYCPRTKYYLKSPYKHPKRYGVPLKWNILVIIIIFKHNWLIPALKKTEIKLGLLTDMEMLLMVETGSRGGICHSVFHYSFYTLLFGLANIKYMKKYVES